MPSVAAGPALILALVLALVAGCPPAPPVDAPPTGESGRPAQNPIFEQAENAIDVDGPGVPFACRLDEPVVSEDRCNLDSDCGVSEPCHARACVATLQARPPGPDTMCTEEMDCRSADANRCQCYQGRCALVPPDWNERSGG